MQDPNRIIEISGSSVIDLKAELFKQKEEFQKQKVAANNQPVSAALRKSVKKPGLWDNQNKGVNERSRRDELEIIDAPTLEASRIAMERKAKLYDQLIKTGIDEYIDEFGRTRVCRKSQIPEENLPTTNGVREETSINSEEISLMEQEKNEWEKAALEELKNGPIHYDETKDEKEREEQLRALKEMRIETEVKRAGYTSVKDKRKAQLDLRMATIRAKKQKTSVKNLQTSDKIIEINSNRESQKSFHETSRIAKLNRI
ncbi:5601_t:CDS:2 [Diversispora eburnea]|uniref:5601_t:CDS:1 n=1 Tax=Diversispora eburnea TaxID=1213867 RepID=A0A9N8YRA9_9GLOM|nr:5601_t:CDS:2 [Diversispora eburnea]